MLRSIHESKFNGLIVVLPDFRAIMFYFSFSLPNICKWWSMFIYSHHTFCMDQALEMEVKQLKEKNRSLKLRLSKYEIQDSMSTAPSFQGQTGSFDSPGLDTRTGLQEPVSWTDSIQNFLIANNTVKGQDKCAESSASNAQYDLTSFQPANTFLGENQPPQDQGQGMFDSTTGMPSSQMYYSQSSQPKISSGITSYQPPPSTLDTGPMIKPDPATWQQSFSIQPLIDMTSDFYYGDLIPEKQQGFQNRTPSESWYLPYSNSDTRQNQNQSQNQDIGTGSWYNTL